MHKTPLFPTLLVLLVFMAAVHLVATYLKWYWSIPWIDRIPHFTAGALVALSSLWLFYLSGYFRLSKPSYGKMFFLSFSSAVVVGLLWEIFEVTFHITSLSSPNYLSNNGGDMLMDMAGAVAGYAYFSYKGYNKA